MRKTNGGQTQRANIMVLGSTYSRYLCTVHQMKSDICLQLNCSFLLPRRPSDEQLCTKSVHGQTLPKGQSLDSQTVCEEGV